MSGDPRSAPDEDLAGATFARYEKFINPGLATLTKFMGFEDVEVAAEGCYVTDSTGNRYLDCWGGPGVFTMGHCHPRIVEAVQEQAAKQPLGSHILLNPIHGQLAERLAEIDEHLRTSDNLDTRLTTWKASKEVGIELRDGLVELQQLRNATVQALGYDDYFSYQVSDYGMTTAELVELMHKISLELRPLYRELHTWARYTLAERYGAEEVPDLIPAHWLPNRWGQDWSSLVSVEGLDLNAVALGVARDNDHLPFGDR